LPTLKARVFFDTDFFIWPPEGYRAGVPPKKYGNEKNARNSEPERRLCKERDRAYNSLGIETNYITGLFGFFLILTV